MCTGHRGSILQHLTLLQSYIPHVLQHISACLLDSCLLGLIAGLVILGHCNSLPIVTCQAAAVACFGNPQLAASDQGHDLPSSVSLTEPSTALPFVPIQGQIRQGTAEAGWSNAGSACLQHDGSALGLVCEEWDTEGTTSRANADAAGCNVIALQFEHARPI